MGRFLRRRGAVSGVGASPDEEMFTFGKTVTLSAVEAGEITVKELWTGDAERAEGVTVQLRCKVPIGADSWIVTLPVTIPARTRLSTVGRIGELSAVVPSQGPPR